MANQYTLDNDFSAIAEPQGTLYNVGDSAIELASSASTAKGQGILLMTGERRTFTGTLYARSMDTTATLNVSDFTEAAGGGDDVADVRRPSTEYAAGALVDGAGLASGLVLRCTTAGTTSSAALDCTGYELGDTITDGTTVWTVEQYVITTDGGTTVLPATTNSVDLGSISKLWRKLYAKRIDEGTYIPGAFNKKETFTTSGTFVAPVTGTYRITLQGGGGGGGGSGKLTTGNFTGGGGGQGAILTFYETLTAGASYAYTIGAGGTGGAAGTSSTSGTGGTNGGTTSITIVSNIYQATGGEGGFSADYEGRGGKGGVPKINSSTLPNIWGCPGGNGFNLATGYGRGGAGGGFGGADPSHSYGNYGGGGSGGNISPGYKTGYTGGNGYITFEYYDPTV